MSQMFRTTLRLDLDKPASAQAASLLRQLHAERGLSYSALIVPAVNAYFEACAAFLNKSYCAGAFDNFIHNICLEWGALSTASPSYVYIPSTHTSSFSPDGFIISICSPTLNLFLCSIFPRTSPAFKASGRTSQISSAFFISSAMPR